MGLLIIILIRALVALGVGIAPAPSGAPGASARPACQGPVVTVAEGHVPACNPAPPTRLDLVMPDASAAAIARCNDDGGEPIEYPVSGLLVCEGVDY
jgi:hypothetical protein